VAPLHDPRDPPAQAGAVGVVPGFNASVQDDASVVPPLEVLVFPLAAALGLLVALAVLPARRLAGITGGVAVRRGPIAIAIVVVLNSILIGIFIAQLGH
jgi:hypothetical protein